MFYKAFVLLCLLAAITKAADDENLATVLSMIFGTTSSTQSAVPDDDTSEPLSAEPGVTPGSDAALNNKVDTLIDRIFGRNETTEKTHGSTTESDLDLIIEQIFNSTSTTTPESPTADSFKESEMCTTPDGRAGVCVVYYMCINNSIIISDGKDQVDIRKRRSIADHVRSRYKRADDDGQCSSYIEECCLLQDQTGNPITEKPDTKGGCGWSNPTGVDNFNSSNEGGTTKFGEFPWMCAIIKIELVRDYKTGGQKIGDVYVGGGSLIHPSVVLTAAHYVASASRIRVRAGVWDSQNPSNAPHPYQLREVTNIDMHKDFNNGNLHNDVALLYLSAPMVPAPNVGVVCLPPPREHIPAGTWCYGTGWGKDRFGRDGKYQVVLKKVEVPVVSHGSCQNRLRKTRLGRYFQLHSSFMCAGGEEGRDTCKGDGGSPLSCPIESEEGRYMQAGIVAWGIGCGQSRIPGVYVDVSYMRTWIDERVTKRGFDPKTYAI